jgi:uncharacterized membrane protein YsdA (DUF1294 family)
VKVLIIYFIIMSIVTFSLMYIDKNRAIKGEWRIPESTFMKLSVLGGGFGTYIGMYTFRHKTKHPKFTMFIPLTIVLNLVSYYLIVNFII